MRAKLLGDHDLACPLDSTPLQKVEQGGATVDRCSACGGAWFDAKELAAVAGEPDVEGAARRLVGVVGASRFGCPRCWGDCMQVRIGAVVADTCTTCHGVWLDAGELEAARLELIQQRAAQSLLTPLQRLLLRIEGALKL